MIACHPENRATITKHICDDDEFSYIHLLHTSYKGLKREMGIERETKVGKVRNGMRSRKEFS